MKNYKMILQYDGTRYNGWQKQGNTEDTIQEKLEKVLSQIGGAKIEIFGSGRTDAGAHALGQVANFHMEWKRSTEELLKAIYEKMPEDIALLSLEEVPERFHSRLNAKSKIYEYCIWNTVVSPVFKRRYAFWDKTPLNLAAMKEAAQYLIGEHDFKNFCSAKKVKKSTVRTVYNINFSGEGDELRIAFHGNGFLYNMVRIMVGTLIEVGEGKRKPQDVQNIFKAENREAAGFTAPAKGLFLVKVFYPTLEE